MGLIAIYTKVIQTGLIITLIGLNEMVTAVIIIIKAVGVDQAHGAVDGLEPWIQTQEHQKKIPAVNDRRKRRKKRKHKTAGEREDSY